MNRFIQVVVLAGTALSSLAWADWRDDVGYTRLQSLVASDLPTSLSKGFTQVEALEGGTNYMPDIAASIFAGKTFTNKTNTSAGISGHANNVASYFYSTGSLLPGTAASPVDVYAAGDWLGSGFLNNGTNNAPLIETRAIQNHSWIATTGDSPEYEEVGRRLDFAIDRDGFVCVVGENNGSSGTLPLLMAQSYHTIAVGLTNSQHSAGFTTLDGSGRIKPDLVAPATATSYSTPMVGSAAGILYQVLNAAPHSLSGADMPRAIKALLLASARKDRVANWDQTSTRPLDDIHGAGELNIHHAFMLMQAGEVTAGTTQHGPQAWACESTNSSASKSYFFTIPSGAPNTPFSAALVWHRVITETAPGAPWGNLTSSLADLTLSLYAATGTTRGALIAQSASAVDNVELIHQAALTPGDYELVVSSASATNTPYALAWHSLPMVSTQVTVAEAREIDGQDAVITVTRSGDTKYPLWVPITVTGDAQAGTHYQALSSSITIPAGQSSATLVIDPIADNTAQGDREVSVAIAADFALVRDPEALATITIKDKPADAWRFGVFNESELADPQISGDAADADADGMANLLEYALGLDPKTGNPSPCVPAEVEGYLAVSVAKNPLASDLTWSAEVTSDLSTWSPATVLVNTSSQFEARDTVTKIAAPKRMIRIKVTRP